MLTGHAVAAAVYYFVGHFLYIAIKSIATLIVSSMCYGMKILGDQVSTTLTETRDAVLSPFVYLLDHVSLNNDFTAVDQINMQGGMLIGLYCIAAVVFYILAYVFYRSGRWNVPVMWLLLAGCTLVFAGCFHWLADLVFPTFFPACSL